MGNCVINRWNKTGPFVVYKKETYSKGSQKEWIPKLDSYASFSRSSGTDGFYVMSDGRSSNYSFKIDNVSVDIDFTNGTFVGPGHTLTVKNNGNSSFPTVFYYVNWKETV